MKRQYKAVTEKQMKSCNKCGAPISFLQLVSGKWIPVDVHCIHGEKVIVTGAGNNMNYKPIHRCRKPARKEETPKAPKATAEEIAQMKAFLDDPEQPEILKKVTREILEKIQ